MQALRVSSHFSAPFVLLTALVACSAGTGSSSSGASGDGDGASGSGDGGDGVASGDGDLDLGDGTDPSTVNGVPVAMIEETLPSGFTASARAPESAWDFAQTQPAAGGTRLVGTVAEFSEEAQNSCVNVLRGIVRDFEHSHVDFGGPKNTATGLVGTTIGDDRKPVATDIDTFTASLLGEWYVNGGGGNVPYVVDFWLEPQGDGSFVFDSSRFYPLEGFGTPSGNDNDGVMRNFGFTTEIHTAFEYKGGEVFNFRGDDDVFVFINKVLAVDLGGVHEALTASVNLDTFAATNGLVVGEVYELDLFHAERNPTGSNFRIETTLDFKECAILEMDLVVR